MTALDGNDAKNGSVVDGAGSLTQREIASQPDVWAAALADLRLTTQTESTLAAPGERVLALGCGTSAFVAQSYAALREGAGLGETDACYASELPPRRTYDRVVAFSRSGTTSEVVDALVAIGPGPCRVAVTAVEGERIDELVDDRLVVGTADEDSVVQTRFPTTVLALGRLALGYDVGSLVADARLAMAQPLVADPSAYKHFVYLGSGWTVGLAHEAALKVREAAQAWSESYPAMDYRHGPIAVAGPTSLVTFLGPAPDGLAEAIRATGATVITSGLDPLAQLIQAQQLAVDLAAAYGLDADRPRALTRSVVLTHPAHSQTGSPR